MQRGTEKTGVSTAKQPLGETQATETLAVPRPLAHRMRVPAQHSPPGSGRGAEISGKVSFEISTASLKK